MRLMGVFTLSTLAFATPADAGSDTNNVPNPFTEQAGSTGSITSVDKGVENFTAPVPNPLPQSLQPDNSTGAAGDKTDKTDPSGGFYESTKKDGSEH